MGYAVTTNRIDSSESKENAFRGLAIAGLFVFERSEKFIINSTKDILYQAASTWKELTEFHYIFTYGYKKQLCTIHLTFSLGEFPHLAGFQYLQDISIPRYNSEKIISRILDGHLTLTQIQKSIQYEKMIVPRLEALIQLKETLDHHFNLFTYDSHKYPFFTQIKANYLISYHSTETNYLFIIQNQTHKTAENNYLCCSAFKQGERNYEINQSPRTLLRKERLHIPSNTSDILLDKLTPHTIE